MAVWYLILIFSKEICSYMTYFKTSVLKCRGYTDGIITNYSLLCGADHW